MKEGVADGTPLTQDDLHDVTEIFIAPSFLLDEESSEVTLYMQSTAKDTTGKIDLFAYKIVATYTFLISRNTYTSIVAIRKNQLVSS